MENHSTTGEAQVRRTVSKYELGQLLGSGAYSQVYQATHTEEKGTFAIKVIANRALAENAKVKQGISNELAVHNVMEPHPNIVRFYELLQTKNNCYFVYEYCSGGTLNDILKREGVLEEERAMEIFAQLVEGLKVLRKHNIMHRDLKPQNVLLSGSKFKLADFAFCKELGSHGMTRTMLGSPLYMAPEVLKGEAYTITADVWSVGVMLYQMLHGYCPFQSSSIAALISTIEECQPKFDSPRPLSSKLRNFILQCLEKDPQKRYSWQTFFEEAEILVSQSSHPFCDSSNSHSQLALSHKQLKLKSYTSQYLDKQRGSKQPQSKSKYEIFKENYNKIEYGVNRGNSSGKKENAFKKSDQKTIHLMERHSDLLPKQRSRHPKMSYLQMIQEHGKCLQALQQMMEKVKSRDVKVLMNVEIGLCDVKQTLEKIYNSINLQDNQMLAILSVVKYELIQVDKLYRNVTEVSKEEKGGLKTPISEARQGLTRLMNRAQ